MDIKDIMEINDEIKPIFGEIVKAVMEYGHDLKPIVEATEEYLTQARIKKVRTYVGEGFSREEAILMTIDDSVALVQAMKSFRHQTTRGNNGRSRPGPTGVSGNPIGEPEAPQAVRPG